MKPVMDKPASHRISYQWWIAAAIAASCVILYFFSPTEHSFYPRCVLHSLTGWWCPGCGSLRAMHQLLHGEIAKAFALNPLLLIALPLVGFAIINSAVRKWTGRELVRFTLPASWIWAILAVIILYTVLRNVLM